MQYGQLFDVDTELLCNRLSNLKPHLCSGNRVLAVDLLHITLGANQEQGIQVCSRSVYLLIRRLVA